MSAIEAIAQRNTNDADKETAIEIFRQFEKWYRDGTFIRTQDNPDDFPISLDVIQVGHKEELPDLNPRIHLHAYCTDVRPVRIVQINCAKENHQ